MRYHPSISRPAWRMCHTRTLPFSYLIFPYDKSRENDSRPPGTYLKPPVSLAETVASRLTLLAAIAATRAT